MNRTFTEARQRQGFKSQEHLDAFFKYYDHTKTCVECNQEGGFTVLADGSLQPLTHRCPIAKELDQHTLGY